MSVFQPGTPSAAPTERSASSAVMSVHRSQVERMKRRTSARGSLTQEELEYTSNTSAGGGGMSTLVISARSVFSRRNPTKSS